MKVLNILSVPENGSPSILQLLGRHKLDCVFSGDTARVKGKSGCATGKNVTISLCLPATRSNTGGKKPRNRVILLVKDLH